uniref:BHLH domain-containing protein n=1 Tax=Oryza meridionalis TaxID=40149 RepID=A0A0E0CYU7_9ORYZ
MASPPPPPQPPSPSAATAGAAAAPVDALFLQNLMSRVQLRPPFLDTNSFLTQDLDEFLLNEFAALSAAAGASDDDDGGEDGEGEGSDGEVVSGEARRRRTLAREEAKLEKEIVRLVLAGEAEEALKPNSGQSVAVGDHHICVGFHDDSGGEYRVWEWHGHVMIFDDEDGYSAEYIYGNHFEPLAAATARAKKKEKEKREKELSSGLRDLIVGDAGSGANGSKENGKGGAPRVVRRNVVNAPAAPARFQKQQLCTWIRHDDLDMLTDELERKRVIASSKHPNLSFRLLSLFSGYMKDDVSSAVETQLAESCRLESVKCEASNSPSTTVGFDRMIAADYDLFHHMSFSPSLQNLQSPTFFTTRSSESYLGESSIYGGGARPALAQFSYSQPIAATSAAHLVRWTAAGEPMTGDGGFRSSKRLKTATTATTQSPRHGVKCHAKPRNQTTKATCKKRSQKLGDKITALQQLVSPYGKTDTASVLHEAAACIRQLHQQIQILTAPYPGTSSSSASSQQVVFSVLESCSTVMSFFTAIATVLWLQDAGGGGGTATELRRRGLCVAALSPAVVSLAAEGGRRRTDVEDQKSIWFSNQ